MPERLRPLAGRREFVRSTGAHDLAVGKLVGAALLAEWRRRLFDLERERVNDEEVLRLVEGAPELATGGFVTLARAAELSGLGLVELTRAAAAGRLTLHCRVRRGAGAGFVVPVDALDPIDSEIGRSGGLVIPRPGEMPGAALVANLTGQVLRLTDGPDVASAILADSLDVVEIVTLEAPGRPGWWFCPDAAIRVETGALEVLAAQVEALRVVAAAAVPPERVEHARSVRATSTLGRAASGGKWASKRFSEAVEGYCASPEGLPGGLASTQEQRQRRKGLLLFAEFVGNLRLEDIDGDTLRAFRDGPLKTLPANVNKLPGALRRETMKETIAALQADGREWPLMSRDMQNERMLWLYRLFAWLHKKKYFTPDPAASLRGETGMTKAERKAAARKEAERKAAARKDAPSEFDDDDDEGRGPFSDGELKQIFGVTHYMTGRGDHVKGNEVWYPFQFWLPLLGLYAGCRIKEASQLHLVDVKKIDGVWCLDINERTADKTLKNDQSTRIVPLHSMLVELGFLDYCDRLRAAKYRRVFPELTYASSDARYAKEPIRKMSGMLKRLGMPRDNTHVFHCSRHNMNNALARVPMAALTYADEGLKKYVRYRVLGHKPGDDINVKHYMHTTAGEMAALVAAIDYDIPPVAKFDIEFGLDRVAFALTNKEAERKGREDMGPLNGA